MSSREPLTHFPTYGSIAPFNMAITTRVMAKRRLSNFADNIDTPVGLPQESDIISYRRRRSSLMSESGRERNPSKFLVGTAIPNSVIQADLNKEEPVPKDKETLRKERDEYVAQLTDRLMPKHKIPHSIYDESVDREAMAKIKRELQRRSLLSPAITNEDMDNQSASTMRSGTDPWHDIKEKRRISRRTSILAPLSGGRRSTYDSIRKAIQNSKLIQNLIDADNIDAQALTDGKTTTPQPVPQYSFLNSQKTDTKEDKLRTPKSSFVSKRKFVPKSDLSSILKNSAAEKEPHEGKRVSISETQKEDLQTQTSFVIDHLKGRELKDVRKLSV